MPNNSSIRGSTTSPCRTLTSRYAPEIQRALSRQYEAIHLIRKGQACWSAAYCKRGSALCGWLFLGSCRRCHRFQS